MVIKIFYIAVAVFSVAMVILSVQTPYFSEFYKQDFSIANMEMTKIIDYEVDENINAKFMSDKGIRYKDRDEFENFYGEFFESDMNHTLKSKIAIYKNSILTFKGDANYYNSNNLNYVSEQIVYNTQTKIGKSDKPFIMTQNEDKVIGKSLKHDLNKKQTFATGVHAWYWTKDSEN